MDNFIRFHLSPVLIQQINDTQPEDELKPIGFWYGFGKNWIQCTDNCYLYKIDIHEYAFTNIDCPDSNKICLLQSADDYTLLKIKYTNWYNFSQDFAGIEFRDQNQGCIFRAKSIINKIILI